MNQKDITYKSLFGDYLSSARKIEIIGPYICASFQIDNLIELIQTVREVNDHSEELQIYVSTQNDDEKVLEIIDIFDSLTDELQSYGITFTYDFKANHDRWIAMDNGWKILLSRGLDIFEKFDRFSLGSVWQEERIFHERGERDRLHCT
jgi:ATP-dependent Lon protease